MGDGFAKLGGSKGGVCEPCKRLLWNVFGLVATGGKGGGCDTNKF